MSAFGEVEDTAANVRGHHRIRPRPQPPVAPFINMV